MPTIYSDRHPPRDPWPALASLLAEADERGFEAKVALFGKTDEERKARSKRSHDIKGALRTLRYTVDALEEGYRFDDERAKAKIEAIARAVRALESEAAPWTEMLAP